MTMGHLMRSVVLAGAALAAGITGAGLVTSPAQADDGAIKALVKSMSDFLASQKSISFDMQTNLEVVTADGQRLALASSGAVEMSRPDKLRAERKGGFADVEAVFDGKTLTLLGRNLNLYAEIPMAGTIDQAVSELRDKYGRPLPAADLLVSDPYGQIMPDAKDLKYLGFGVILGQSCEHVAMRVDDVDIQLWIAQGDKPYPCRYTITSHTVPGQPQYSVDVWNWKSSADAGSADFTFTPPSGATKVEPAKLTDTDELPSHLTPKN